MELDSTIVTTTVFQRISGFASKLSSSLREITNNVKKIGEEDPRRVTHSFKVALALTLVSIFYYIQPFYDNMGSSAMWSVMTVVVVFEFSVGATIYKAINRTIATVVAGGLGLGVYKLVSLTGGAAEPILLQLFVFLQAVVLTFMRFFPKIRARVDYGLMIFVLTFSLVSISGYRDGVTEIAWKRISTIIIGSLVCSVVSLAIFPVWAGEDLHTAIALNLEKLGDFLLDDCCCEEDDPSSTKQKRIFVRNKDSIICSRTDIESLANNAWWEPGHGKFLYGHPWKLYLRIGELTSQCSSRIRTLSRRIEEQDEKSMDNSTMVINEACSRISLSSGKALKEIALAMKTMTHLTPSVDTQIEKAKLSAGCLVSLLQSEKADGDLHQKILAVNFASLFLDIVSFTEEISEAVSLLEKTARFKNDNVKPEPPSPESPCSSIVLINTHHCQPNPKLSSLV